MHAVIFSLCSDLYIVLKYLRSIFHKIKYHNNVKINYDKQHA